jgi:hypothetical protein
MKDVRPPSLCRYSSLSIETRTRHVYMLGGVSLYAGWPIFEPFSANFYEKALFVKPTWRL